MGLYYGLAITLPSLAMYTDLACECQTEGETCYVMSLASLSIRIVNLSFFFNARTRMRRRRISMLFESKRDIRIAYDIDEPL